MTFWYHHKSSVILVKRIQWCIDSAGNKNQFFHSTNDFTWLFLKSRWYKFIVPFIPRYRVPNRLKIQSRGDGLIFSAHEYRAEIFENFHQYLYKQKNIVGIPMIKNRCQLNGKFPHGLIFSAHEYRAEILENSHQNLYIQINILGIPIIKNTCQFLALMSIELKYLRISIIFSYMYIYMGERERGSWNTWEFPSVHFHTEGDEPALTNIQMEYT